MVTHCGWAQLPQNENAMKKLIIPLSVIALLAGCTSATRETVNTLPKATPKVSPTLAAPEQLGLKRVVAIARFSDETKRGTSFLLDKNNDRLGKQASDILAARLTETQKFVMLERSDLDKVLSENKFDGSTMEKVGAGFLIVGSVSEFGRSTTSEVGIFSRNKIQKANATVNVRLINTHTGQIVYSEEASGEATVEANHVFNVGERSGYDTSIDDKALSAAISKLVSNISENLLDAPWRAYLVGQQEGYWLMTGGKSQGVKVGDVFDVVAPGKQVKNPQTGMMINLPGKKVATLRVTAFVGSGSNELSLCELASGSIDSKQTAQLVVEEKGKA
ncbi:curli biogenesis system outer membrane secretion channel CsgG [Gallaecimonas pentaromativorans]|uniref:Curli production assembly/transport component CsgG n=2 Tax=Gallaecimonas pentaromativorans TaxID=584787 RepID=A0A3N1P9F6_9GAMM|nr:curli biogenesis system outer membrane secretion channel CsgG [Gallaecimonas pentaromativorans]